MSDEVMVGVYLERHGGAVMRATASGTTETVTGRGTLKATHFNQINWNPKNADEAQSGLQQLAKIAAQMGGGNLKSIAISAPGPFLSLNPGDEGRFGVIHPEVSHLPLRGFDIPTMFREGISGTRGSVDTLITVHTDAEACAIGEAIARNLPEKNMLAFILVTEGIGLGVVQGRTPLRSALHSEIGVLHVRWDRQDVLKPREDDRLFAKSLSEMAENSALRERFKMIHKVDHVADSDILSATDTGIWDLRAYYLAQACLACAVILAPHRIVLGADLDVDRSIASRTDFMFRAILDARKKGNQPVFEFEELKAGDYISLSVPITTVAPEPSFRATGALGMCYAAADAHLRVYSQPVFHFEGGKNEC